MTDHPKLTGKRADAARMWADSDWRDMATFIGPNAGRFERVWDKMRAQAMAKGAGFAQSWCWPALFGGFAWFFYRKMWAIGAVLLVVPVMLGLFVSSNGAAIGLSVASATLARGAYVQHALGRIAAIRAAGGGDAEIAAAGGVSRLGGAIGVVLLTLTFAAVIWSIASGNPVDI